MLTRFALICLCAMLLTDVLVQSGLGAAQVPEPPAASQCRGLQDLLGDHRSFIRQATEVQDQALLDAIAAFGDLRRAVLDIVDALDRHGSQRRLLLETLDIQRLRLDQIADAHRFLSSTVFEANLETIRSLARLCHALDPRPAGPLPALPTWEEHPRGPGGPPAAR